MEIIEQLGRLIEDRWRDANYDEALLPDIAAEELARAQVNRSITAWDAAEWVLDQIELPRQKDPAARFGDPPITLFTAPRFFIDIYFWLEGTTSVHQHGFCGAFQVLMGSSLHSWYEFERHEAINVSVETGSIKLKDCQILDVGDIKKIRPGRQYIHSLFHLEQPSATLVVRTGHGPLSPPQFNYNKPSLAIDPFYEDETTTKKLQTLAALLRVNFERVDDLIGEWLAKSDFMTAFQILSVVHSNLFANRMAQAFALEAPRQRFEKFLDIANRRLGAKAAGFADVFAYRRRTSEIVAQRNYVTNPEHRFFLALVMNIDDRDHVLELVRQRYPDREPVERVLDWIQELSETRLMGANGANALNIADFDAIDMSIVEGLMTGKSLDAITVELEHLKAELDRGGVEARAEKLRESAIIGLLVS